MSAPHDDQRDPVLSALLRANVDAPPLRRGFRGELEARLRAEEVARGSTAADGGRAGATVRSVSASRHRRLTTRRLIAAAAVVAAAAVFAFAVLPAIRGGATATAGDILAAMTAASGGAETVRLHSVTVTIEDAPAHGKYERYRRLQRETSDLTLSIQGDFASDLTRDISYRVGEGSRVRYPSRRATGTYADQRHELRRTSSSGDRQGRLNIRRPAWPDGNIGDYSSLSASLRAELAETNPDTPVETTEYLGRPAWHAELLQVWPANDWRTFEIRAHWVVTVDKETGLLVAATYRLESDKGVDPVRMDVRVTRLELDPALPDEWQLLPIPSSGRVLIVDEGTRFGTPEQVARRSWPTLPLIPQWAPGGFRLTDVASAGCNGVGAENGYLWRADNGGRVVRRNGRFAFRRMSYALDWQTVLARFRRGFGTFVVQVTPKALGERLSSITPPEESDAQDVTLTGGFLEGAKARTWIGLQGPGGAGPTLLTFSDRSRVLIRGDLTRQELIDVANSMKAYGDVDRPPLPGYGE